MKRELTSKILSKVGEVVKVAGWVNSVRDHGQLIFIDMRDWDGVVQIVVNPEDKEIFETAKSLGSEYVIEVIGEIQQRDEGLINDKIASGKIEIKAQELEILNKSKVLPFPIDTDGREIDENVRLKYRYVDLRRPRVKGNIIKRHKYISAIRNWMNEAGFLDVTTPLLATSSPEGARDFVVPSRMHPGKVYVLPQAPQQFKQLLMVGGVDKYYQIAPCARDEDPRADRHYGVFYQVDMEMSFPTQEALFETAENLIKATYTAVAPEKEIVEFPFPRIPFNESMDRFGSDKPDLRFGLELQDLTDVIKGKTDFNVFNSVDFIKCIVVEKGAEWTRKDIDEMEAFAKQHGAKGLAYMKYIDGKFESGIAKFMEPASEAIAKALDLKGGELLLFGAGKRTEVNKILGAVRSETAKKQGLLDNSKLAFAWVTDFPFFEESEVTGKMDFGHNPFSMPKGGMKAFETDDPYSIETIQYDLAVNGYEVISGSIRNHNPEILVKAFEMVGYDKEEVLKRFGGMYTAFQYGAPPHGGWAIGLDRLFMVLIDEDNIRDVYAFPKSSSGMDLMMDSPSIPRKEDMDNVNIEFSDKGLTTATKIKSILENADIKFEYKEHESVRTSEEAAKIRGTKLSEGAKAMVLQSLTYTDKLIQIVIPADKQLDLNKAKEIIGEDLKIADADLIYNKIGLKIGGIPPMGRIFNLEVYYDKTMYSKAKDGNRVAFNCGTRTQSIIMLVEDLIKTAQPNVVSSESDFLG
jgi:aspartyl-tRNA synthetase